MTKNVKRMEKRMRKMLVAIIIFILILTMLPIHAFALPASSWAVPEVTAFLNSGLMPQRLSEGDFRDPITRANFSILMMHAYPMMSQNPIFLYQSAHSPFTDTTEPDIIWAFQRGIVSGTGAGQFTPDRIINRAEIAVMFHNLLVTLEKAPRTIQNTQALNRFQDGQAIPHWAEQSVALLVEMGVMQGTGQSFAPLQTATFEQAMLMINRLYGDYMPTQDFFSNQAAGQITDNAQQDEAPLRDFTLEQQTQQPQQPGQENQPVDQIPPNHAGPPSTQLGPILLDGVTARFDVPSENVNRPLQFHWHPISGAVDYEVTVLRRRISVAPIPIPEPIPTIQRTGGAAQFTIPEIRPIKNYTVTVVGIDAVGMPVGYNSVEFTTSPAPRPVPREAIFFNGENTTPGEKQAAAATITVRIWRLNERTGVRTSGTETFQIHHALANVMKAIFEDIYNGPERFPIRDIHTIRPGSVGEHGRGTAIDINANENWYMCLRTGTTVGSFWRPFENPFSITPYGDVVTAFERHGFTWGGDSWRNAVDYMHFSYFGT